METLEQLQSIIDNAPHDATHYEAADNYLKLDSNDIWSHAYKRGCIGYAWHDADCNNIGRYISIRSLSDIKRIIELEKKLTETRFDFNHGVKCSNIPNDLAM